MKRYWKFIVLSLFTVAILGGYYVKTSAKQNNGYAIALKNHSGDSEVVKDLTIQGDFTNLQTYNYTTFKLTNNQTSFENDLSYLKKLDGVFQDSPRLRNYVEVHHSFMRGKLRIPYLFSEDTEYLSYVNDETTYEGNGYTQELTISRLNKETNKIDEFTYALPNNTSEASYYVSDTFYKDEKVYALLQRSEYTENAQKDTYELFVWDFDSQKMIIENNPLTFLPDEKNTIIQLIESSSEESTLDYAAFIVTSGESIDEYGELQGEVDSYVFILDYVSGELKKVKNETSTELSNRFGGQRTQEELYLFMFQKDSPLLKVDIKMEAPEATQLIEGNPIEEPVFDEQEFVDDQSESTEPEEADYMNIIHIHDGKMYALDAIQDKNQVPILSVIDIESGKEVYNGSIELNNGDALPMPYEVYFHYMFFDNE